MADPKSQTQIRLDKLQEESRNKARSSTIREEIIDTPSDIDKDRLQEFAAQMEKETSKGETELGKIPKVSGLIKRSEESSGPSSDPQDLLDSVEILILSVTTLPFIPAKESVSDVAPEVIQKYQILVESSQPLQLGKVYHLKA